MECEGRWRIRKKIIKIRNVREDYLGYYILDKKIMSNI